MKPKIFCKKRAALMAAILMAVIIVLMFTVLAAAEQSDSLFESRPEIDVWLIAGQSNAVGFGSDGLSAAYMNDERYTEGFDNVLFWGKYESTYNPEDFVPVTVGLGKQSNTAKTTVGAEIGIAAALADSARMNAVIKRAVGGAFVYPTTNGSVSLEHGTWTPPSYLEKYSIDTSENKIGDLYTSFIDTAKEGIEMLIEDGYTPVLRGIWWMQGEAETPYEVYANAYEELLDTLISDMREDLGEITGTDQSNLAFVMGKITRNPNPSYEQYDYVDTVNAAQVAITSSVENTHIVDTSGLVQLDGWHYSADSQHYIGTQFVDKVISSMGKYSVTLSGAGVSMTGGGAKSAGESVTVTFALEDGFTLNSLTMSVAGGEAVPIELDEGGSYTFTMPAGNVVFGAVATDPNAQMCEYGVIYSRYTDAQKYPFLLFKSGELVYAYEDWHTFVNSNNISDCTLLLRRDYDTSEGGDPYMLCRAKGLTIDLGNHTFTRGSKHMFQALSRDTFVNSASIRVKNGTLKTTWSYTNDSGTTNPASPLIVFNGGATSTIADNFEFVFDGVTFDVSSGRGIVACYGNGTHGNEAKIILNDCKIDRGSCSSSTTLFSLADSSGNKNDIHVEINGGTLEGDSLAKLTFATYSEERENGKGSPDKVTLGKGANGNEFKLVLPKTYTVPLTKYALSAGNHYPVLEKEENSKKIYNLVNLTTPYGDVDPANADAVAYPFVIFKNGEMIGAASAWHTFINNFAKNESTLPGITAMRSGATLYLRRDYDTSEGGDSWAMCFIDDLTIDLGGHTFTRGAYHMFQAMGRTSDANETKITVRNGTLKTTWSYVNASGATKGASPLICFNNHSSSTVNDKFDFCFEGVTFDLSSGRGIVAAYGDGSYGTESTVTLNDCIIDFGAQANAGTVFDLADSSGNKNDVRVLINGGTLRAQTVKSLKLASYSPERESGKGSPDSVFIGKSQGGEEFRMIISSSAGLPTEAIALTNGKYYPVLKSGNSTYTLVSLNTPYGDIKPENADAAAYPFVIFKNGEMIGAASAWHTFINNFAKNESTLPGITAMRSGATLYLRRDYDTSEGGDSWAMCFIDDLTIDLGGHTFTRGAYHMFQAMGRTSDANETKITVRNGTLRTTWSYVNASGVTKSSTPLICFNNHSSSTINDKFDFCFEGVNFDLSSGRGIVSAFGDGTYGINATVTLNDCTVNCGKLTYTMTVFGLADSSGNKNDVKVTVNGGKLIADSITNLTFASYSAEREAGKGSPDSFYIGAGDDGKPFVIELPSAYTAPKSEYMFTEGSHYLAKVEDNGETVSYAFTQNDAVNSFSPRMNLTLDRDLILNIYIPAHDKLTAVKLGDEILDLGDLELKDGYYVKSVALAAKEAAADIKLTCTLESVGTGSFTLSVPKYAEKILSDSVASATEKALVRDVLAYIRAAYAYFGTRDAETIAKINTLIGESYSNKPVAEGSATAETSGMKSVTFVLDGTPSMRFYLADGADASSYEFFIDGNRVKTEAGADGKYIDIDVYAYALCETVTYTIDGVESGSFHINAYYTYVSGSSYTGADKAELVTLTECFWRYLQSARDYRNSVVKG